MIERRGYGTDTRIISHLNPHVEIMLHQADELKMDGKYEKAIEVYDQVITIDPRNARAFHSRANVLDMMGRFEDAISSYNDAIVCDPLNAETWYNKGLTLKKIGKRIESFACVQRGLYIYLGTE